VDTKISKEPLLNTSGYGWDEEWMYSGRKITESLGNVTVRGAKDGTSKGKPQRPTVYLSMYSITENIYYSQLSSVAILLQPEPVSHRIIQEEDCVLSLSLSLCYRLAVFTFLPRVYF
jgi:hypothetical protein